MDPLIILIFIVVGIIVSLDVSGLTLTLRGEFASGQRSLCWWAVSNGGWHAFLLFLYILVISGIFNITLSSLDWISNYVLMLGSFVHFLPENFNDYVIALFASLREHSKLVLGLVTLFIVWNTYSKKIVSTPDLGSREELPLLAGVRI